MATIPAPFGQGTASWQQPSAEAPANGSQAEAKARFLPLDAYRGLIMLVLVSNGFGFARLSGRGVYRLIAEQFEHRPWGGTVFYDLIMPAFLFMVGVAMPYAFARRAQQGFTWRDTTRPVLIRCLRLAIISEILVSIDNSRTDEDSGLRYGLGLRPRSGVLIHSSHQ